jgi:RNA polymerase sigma factor (sigma-70 family)
MGTGAEGSGVYARRDGGPSLAPSQDDDLERIFTLFLDPVHRFIYTRVGNREDAEDLTSQIFLKASTQLDSSRTEASVASWLFTVARTVLADHWRRYYRAPVPLELNDNLAAHPTETETGSASTAGSERVVQAVLQALPPRYQRVLELRFLEGYSIDEAAEEMNVTPGNLKVLQHRALARAAALDFPSSESGRDLDASPLGVAGSVTVRD